jgi:hypothetical protein
LFDGGDAAAEEGLAERLELRARNRRLEINSLVQSVNLNLGLRGRREGTFRTLTGRAQTAKSAQILVHIHSAILALELLATPFNKG